MGKDQKAKKKLEEDDEQLSKGWAYLRFGIEHSFCNKEEGFDAHDKGSRPVQREAETQNLVRPVMNSKVGQGDEVVEDFLVDDGIFGLDL